MTEVVRYEVVDGTAVITLNRPDQLNSMNEELLEETLTALRNAASDDAVRVLILTGAGRAFCAGGDLGGMAAGNAGGLSGEGSVQLLVDRLRLSMTSSRLLHEMPKPTIAAINGACAGAGLAWACAADIRLCSEKAVFNTAFATAGLSGDFGGTWLLPRIVGGGKARELYLLAEKFDSAEALRIGLVSKRVAPDDLMPEALAMARRMTGFSPLVLPAIKANLNDSEHLGLSGLMDREAERHIRLGLTEDAREAADAFLAKRPPVFHGR